MCKKMEGAHLKCVKSHFAKFEYKGMKTVGFTAYINRRHLSILDGKYMSSTPPKLENIH